MNIEKPMALEAEKEDLSEWYSQVLEAAEIIDKRYLVKGCFVWLPYGFRIIKNVYINIIFRKN